jgi:hypothetical protein
VNGWLNRLTWKRLSRRSDEDIEHTYRYGTLAGTAIRHGRFDDLGFQVADVEVIPDLTGAPEGMFIWFIFGTTEEADRAKRPDDAGRLIERARTELNAAGFPVEALPTVEFDSTSLPEIEAGGGRFYFFR